MDDEDFRKLFERLIENYELEPEVADALFILDNHHPVYYYKYIDKTETFRF